MKGLQHFHPPGEASNYRSPFDRALLSVAEGLRANGSLRLSTALFRLKSISFDAHRSLVSEAELGYSFSEHTGTGNEIPSIKQLQS